MLAPCVFPIADSSHVSAARSALAELTTRHGFDEVRAGRGSLLLTEAATNILKHAGEGSLAIRTLRCSGRVGVEVIAIDRGPGIADWTHSTTDGVSTAGTSGTGLGAMRRLSDEFEAYSRQPGGTAIRMALWVNGTLPEAPELEIGVVYAALHPEEACGDSWGCRFEEGSGLLVLADGLGHGQLAHEASQAAVDLLETMPDGATPSRFLQSAHGALRPTRGAALAIARFNQRREEVVYAGAGNISGLVWGATERRQMISHAGITGHKIHSIRELTYPWPAGSLLIMHSDGLETRWDLDRYPGLAERHPALVAAILYRDHTRGRDDVAVVALRSRRH